MFYHFFFLFFLLKTSSSSIENKYLRLYNFSLVPIHDYNCCKKDLTFFDVEFDAKIEYKIIKHICHLKSSDIKKNLNINNINKVHKLFFELINDIISKSKLFEGNFKEEVKYFLIRDEKAILSEWYTKFFFMLKIHAFKNSKYKNSEFLIHFERRESPLYFDLSCKSNILYFSLPSKLLTFFGNKLKKIDEKGLVEIVKDLGYEEKDPFSQNEDDFCYNDIKKFADEYPKIKENFKSSQDEAIKFKVVFRIKLGGVFSYIMNIKCSCVSECTCDEIKRIKKILLNEKKTLEDSFKFIEDVLKTEYPFCKEVQVDIVEEYKANIDRFTSNYILNKLERDKFRHCIEESKKINYSLILFAKNIISCRNNVKCKILNNKKVIGSVKKNHIMNFYKNSNDYNKIKDKSTNNTTKELNNFKKTISLDAQEISENVNKYYRSQEYQNIESRILNSNPGSKFEMACIDYSTITITKDENEIESKSCSSRDLKIVSMKNPYKLDERIKTLNEIQAETNKYTDDIKPKQRGSGTWSGYGKKDIEKTIVCLSNSGKEKKKCEKDNSKHELVYQKDKRATQIKNDSREQNKYIDRKSSNMKDELAKSSNPLGYRSHEYNYLTTEDNYIDKSYSKSHVKKVLEEIEIRENRKKIAKEKKKEKKSNQTDDYK